MRLLAFLACLTIGSGFFGACLAGDGLAEFNGKWSGRGKLAMEVDGPMQAALCKATVHHVSAKRLVIDGKCAVGAGRTDVSLVLERTDQGTLLATLSSTAIGSDLEYSGVERNGRFNLWASRRASVAQELADVMFNLSIVPTAGDEFRLSQSVIRTDTGHEYPSIALVFRRHTGIAKE